MLGDIILHIETKVYQGNQTTIPSSIRKKYDVEPDDIVDWILHDDGKITIEFRKKVSVNELIGIGKTEDDTEETKDDKRGLYKWDNTL